MKKIIFVVALLFVASSALAHSGGTDRCGGHNNRKTGGYHVHNYSKYNSCYPPKVEQKEKNLENKPSSKSKITNDTIREMIISESISSYPGNCPCPYNRASNGSRCGKRSAWSKPGGYSPICYQNEITDKMVLEYRKKQGGK